MERVEIYQQPNRLLGELQIRTYLRLVNWRQSFNSFQFNNDSVFNEKIKFVACLKLDAIINNRYRNFGCNS